MRNITIKKVGQLKKGPYVAPPKLPLQNMQISTDLPGSRNIQTMTENQNQNKEKVKEVKHTRGNALPIRLQPAWGNTKPISKVGKLPDIKDLKDMWRNPARPNNPFASSQNRETQKREKMARRQAVANFSKRISEKAKAKAKKPKSV